MCSDCRSRDENAAGEQVTAGTAVPPGHVVHVVHVTERVLAWPLIAVVKVYQFTLSPVLGRQCRFAPTCSWYALDALRKYGGVRGGWMMVKRLARCHPFSKGGYDPVV